MSEVRLIDANALERTAIPCEIHNGALTELCVPLYQIRVAPTVTPDMAQFLAYESGKASAERPTGEWIMNKTSARGRNYTCTHCNKISRNKSEYCPKCGAKMKEAEND